VIFARARPVEISTTQMIYGDIDFQDAPAVGALKDLPRAGLIVAPRAADFIDYTHRLRSSLHSTHAPVLQSRSSRAPLEFVQRFFQLPFKIADVKTYSAGAVQNSDTDHNEIEAFARRRLIGMIVQVMIDALLQS